MLRARYAVSVAIITSATLGRRRSSRPVGFAVGDVGFPFAPTKIGRDAVRISPARILDPLWGSECRGRAENNSSGEYRFQFHGTNSWRGIHIGSSTHGTLLEIPVLTEKCGIWQRLRPISWLPRISLGLTIAQLSARLRCFECGGQVLLGGPGHRSTRVIVVGAVG